MRAGLSSPIWWAWMMFAFFVYVAVFYPEIAEGGFWPMFSHAGWWLIGFVVGLAVVDLLRHGKVRW